MPLRRGRSSPLPSSTSTILFFVYLSALLLITSSRSVFSIWNKQYHHSLLFVVDAEERTTTSTATIRRKESSQLLLQQRQFVVPKKNLLLLKQDYIIRTTSQKRHHCKDNNMEGYSSPTGLHHRRTLLVRGGNAPSDVSAADQQNNDDKRDSTSISSSPLPKSASEAPITPSLSHRRPNKTDGTSTTGSSSTAAPFPTIPFQEDDDDETTKQNKNKMNTSSSSSVAVVQTISSGGALVGTKPKPTTSQTQKQQQSKEEQQPNVSSLRSALFPIYGTFEVQKFLLLGTLKFCIVLALVLTRDCKDTLVVTQIGAEAIAFLKVYGVLPAATAFIAWYSKLSNMFGPSRKQGLFYATCIPFFVFFFVFDVILYRQRHFIEPSIETVQTLLHFNTKSSSSTLVASILSHWTLALFYIVAEVYSSASISLLFWQFANDVVSLKQAPRMYPLFAQVSGLAPIVAGQYVVRYASQAPTFQGSLDRLTFLITSAGIGICVLYGMTNRFLIKHKDPSVMDEVTTEDVSTTTTSKDGTTSSSSSSTATKKKKKKPKLSMMESIKFLASSQYLRYMSILVIGYGLSINFTEIMWKSLVKKRYPDALDYQRYMGQFSSILGISTMLVIVLGVHLIRILGWKAGAMATPTLMALLAIPFFGCILMPGQLVGSRLSLAVTMGAIQSLFSKTGKYAMFDPTTQMAYIPLDDESKTKGKAAIDVLGSRIGKSGGSLIQQMLVLQFGGNILNATPIVMVIFYSVLLTWMDAARRLSHLFIAKSAMKEAERKKE